MTKSCTNICTALIQSTLTYSTCGYVVIEGGLFERYLEQVRLYSNLNLYDTCPEGIVTKFSWIWIPKYRRYCMSRFVILNYVFRDITSSYQYEFGLGLH